MEWNDVEDKNIQLFQIYRLMEHGRLLMKEGEILIDFLKEGLPKLSQGDFNNEFNMLNNISIGELKEMSRSLQTLTQAYSYFNEKFVHLIKRHDTINNLQSKIHELRLELEEIKAQKADES